MLKAILISSMVLNVGLLLGRFSGLIRQSFIGNAFAVGDESDVVVFMLTVPDFLVNILMGGALGAVLIPVFSKNQEQAKKLLYQALLLFGVLSCILSFFLFWQSDVLVWALTGWNGEKAESASRAFGYVVILIPLTVMAGGTTAFLHYKDKFALPSLGTLIINTSIILGLYLVYRGVGGIQLLAMFVIAGGAVRLATQLYVSKPTINISPWLLERSFFKHYGRAMLSISILIFFPIIAKKIASYATGDLTTMDFAFKLIQFPLAIAVTFIATVLLPRLVSSFLQSDTKTFSTLFTHGIQATLVLSCIAAATLYVVSTHYASLVYRHGEMSEDFAAIATIGAITAVGLLSVPLQGLTGFFTTTFFAQKKTITPLLINSIGLVMFLLLGWFQVLGSSLVSLMWSLLMSYSCICALYLIALQWLDLRVLQAIVQPRFITPLLVVLCIPLGCGFLIHHLPLPLHHLIQQQEFGSLVAVSLSLLSGTASLLLFALLHSECRDRVLGWLRTRV